MPDFSFDEAWLHYYRDNLRRRYGAGAVVAVYDGAIVDWGDDIEQVRARAEAALGEPAFVSPIPSDPSAKDDFEINAEYERYRVAKQGRGSRRRVSMWDAYEAADELGILGTKTEYVDGCITIDGTERRFADHDYRLLVERGAVPKGTELIAGIVFYNRSGDGTEAGAKVE